MCILEVSDMDGNVLWFYRRIISRDGNKENYMEKDFKAVSVWRETTFTGSIWNHLGVYGSHFGCDKWIQSQWCPGHTIRFRESAVIS